MVRVMWQPAGSNGPQYGEWEEHVSVLLACAQREVDERRARNAEYEARTKELEKKENKKKRAKRTKKP